MITLKGIKKSFYNGKKKVEVLKGIDLYVAKGEKIAIVGPSGSGKTTLLNLVGGLDKPDEGVLLWGDKPIDFQNEEVLTQYRKSQIGFIFQFYHLMPELTVFENVILPGLMAGWRRNDCYQRGEELLRRLNLFDKASSKIYVLSGGERQKVAIARALFLKPQLLLADEPTGNLDTDSAKEVIKLILELNQMHNLTLMLVTHNMSLAQKMDKIYLLKEGFIVEYNHSHTEEITS